MSHRILVVEDDATLRRVLCDMLCLKGYDVTSANDGVEGLSMLVEHAPHLVIADVMLPRMDGFEMVRRMRGLRADVEVLFLSALDGAEDVVEGFRSGGHDYLRKPFDMNELLVRIEALLLRTAPEEPKSVYTIGRYQFDAENETLTLDDAEERLSSREAAILRHMVEHRGRVVESRELLMELWGDDSYYNLRSLNVFVSRLRGKLSKDSSVQISSVRGVGYKLGCKE